MSNDFDPYHRWLGIPPKHQPADHYRLLAIERFEDDPEVIADAAERQIAHVRRYALGPHQDISQQILNELAAAKVCLLQPDKKAEYDRKLREQVGGQEQAVAPVELQAQEPLPPANAMPPVREELQAQDQQAIPSRAITRGLARRVAPVNTAWQGAPNWRVVAFAVGFGSLVLAFALVLLLRPPASNSELMSIPAAASGHSAEPEPPPLAISPFDAAQARGHQRKWAKYLGVEEEFTNSIGMKFTLIPSGECPMSLLSATERRHEDAVLQRVKMMKPFFLGIFEVTQREYERIMGVNPSRFSGKGNQSGRVSGMDTTRFPVEGVSWWDAVEFCEKLSALPKEREQGRRFRLPTEAEWDYACRAGSEYAFHFGNDPKQLATFAWYGDNSGESTVETDGPFRTLKFAEYWDMIYANGGRPHSVGSRAQNPWGLFDMHGNVWEYCFPAEPTTGEARACRGGSWFFPSTMCQLVHRRMQLPDKRFNDCGFRAVCAIRD